MSKRLLNIEELCGRIEEHEGRNFIINIINGANSVITFDKLDFADVKMGINEYLTFDTYEENNDSNCSCVINVEDIVEIYKDIYEDTNIILNNGQVIQMELGEN